jgi:hypothetical protein
VWVVGLRAHACFYTPLMTLRFTLALEYSYCSTPSICYLRVPVAAELLYLVGDFDLAGVVTISVE